MFACTEVIELDVNQTPDNEVVIQGLVTDSFSNNLVVISNSLGLYDDPEFRGIAGAEVFVEEFDGEGNLLDKYDYVDLGAGSDTAAGFYFSSVPFRGVADNIYRLTVNLANKTYTAEDQLRPVAPMDSLVVEIDEDRKKDLESNEKIDSLHEDFGRYYQLLLYATEPPQTIDYYQWNFYRNGELENNEGRSLFYSDDKLIQESINGFPAPVYYAMGDTFYVEQLSLTREGYIFISDLDRAMNNDGGMFSPPPANPRTNISNGAFGFFQVSSVDAQWGIIKED